MTDLNKEKDIVLKNASLNTRKKLLDIMHVEGLEITMITYITILNEINEAQRKTRRNSKGIVKDMIAHNEKNIKD